MVIHPLVSIPSELLIFGFLSGLPRHIWPLPRNDDAYYDLEFASLASASGHEYLLGLSYGLQDRNRGNSQRRNCSPSEWPYEKY